MIKATASLLLLGLAAAVGHGGAPPPLAGAVPAKKFDARYALVESLGQEAAEAASAAGYTYTLSVNASLPIRRSLDQCIAWPAEEEGYDPHGVSNGYNFTWYGLTIQLPDDGRSSSGFRYPDASQATKEQGYVQDYGANQMILQYNITTGESQPTIRINSNDRLFWDVYKFDFVQGGDKGASTALDGGSYQEFNREMNGEIYCWTNIDENSRTAIMPVVPTLTISMRRLSGTPAPPPASSSVTIGASPGKVIFLGLLAFSAVWASAMVE